MSKNKTKKKLSSFKIFCLSSLTLLILIVGSTFLYTLSLEIGRNSSAIITRIDEVIGGLRVNRFVKNQYVKDTLTYTIPSGWTEEDNSETGTVTLKSGDYNRNLMQGVGIFINVTPKDIFMTLGEIKREITKVGTSNFVDIQIDNIPGIKSVAIKDRSEGYTFIKGKYLIQIDALILPQNINTDMQNRYWNDINSVINSIRFK